MSTRFLLVRHGACAQMDELLFGRAVDAPLDESGELQADLLAERLAREPHVLVEASPRRRTQQTARAIASRARCELRTSFELDEIDFGRWAGQSFTELAKDPLWTRWNERRGQACTASGETMQAVQDRVVRRLARLHEEQPEGSVVLVTHAEIIRAVLLHFLGEPLQRYFSIRIDPASISVVRMDAGRGAVLAMNRPAHEHGIHA